MTPEFLKKFENCDDLDLAIRIYDHAQMENTEEVGSVFEGGWAALVLLDDMLEYPHDAYIVMEDEEGFVSYEAFNNHEQAELRFQECVEEYYAALSS